MIASAIVIILVISILFAPITAELGFKGRELSVRVLVMGIPILKAKPKKKEIAEETTPEKKAEDFEKRTKSLAESLRRFSGLCKTSVRLLRKYTRIKDISISINVGTGDAAVTAVSTGALWAAVYTLLGIAGSVIYIDKHNVNIVPDYTQPLFNAEGKCIIKSRIAYIIIIAITVLIKIKHLKGKED